MVVYGFLSCEKGYVKIPNRELEGKFDDMLLKEPSMGYVNRLAEVSLQMLKATPKADTAKMTEILEFVKVRRKASVYRENPWCGDCL